MSYSINSTDRFSGHKGNTYTYFKKPADRSSINNNKKCYNDNCFRCSDITKYTDIWDIIGNNDDSKHDIVTNSNGYPLLKQSDYFDLSTILHTVLQTILTFVIRTLLGYIDNDSMIWFSTPLIIMAGFIQIIAATTSDLQKRNHDFFLAYNKLITLSDAVMPRHIKIDILSMVRCDSGIEYEYYQKYYDLRLILRSLETPVNHGDNIRLLLYILCVYCTAICVGPILYISDTYASDALAGCLIFIIYFLMNIFYYVCNKWQKPFVISNIDFLQFY